MTQSAALTPRVPVAARPTPGRFSWSWLGVMPFFLFAFAFLLLPAVYLIIFSFQDDQGQFTLANIGDLFQPFILQAYWLSIQVSAITAIGGGLFGFLLAYAALLGGLPRWVRTLLLTFSGVSANFAGVPLAFAFIATLGRVGLVTVLLHNLFNVNLYDGSFNLYTLAGLSLTYMYFQFPLMVLV